MNSKDEKSIISIISNISAKYNFEENNEKINAKMLNDYYDIFPSLRELKINSKDSQCILYLYEYMYQNLNLLLSEFRTNQIEKII